MSVRAKFKVQRIERMESMRDTGRKAENGTPIYENCEIRTVILAPVYSSDPSTENHKFWSASPSGEVRLGTINQSAWEYFELGKEYYLDFTKAEEKAS